MNCPHCQTPNEAGAYYCKNCRRPLSYYPPQGQPATPYVPYTPAQPASDRGVVALAIYTGWGIFVSLVWLLLQKLIIPSLDRGNDYNWETTSFIYNITSWVTNILSLLLAIALAILTTNKLARTLLIVSGAVNLVVFLIYQFVN